MRIPQRMILYSLLLITALLLAACPAATTPAQPPAEAPADTAAPAAPAAPGVTSIQLMGWASSEAENNRLQEVVNTFNEQNADIDVQLSLVPQYDERLQASLAGGSPPAVFYVDSFRLPDLVQAGALEPYEPHALDPDDFFESLRTAFTWDGTFYCPPKDFSTLALQYNMDLFDEAGVEYPTADWTWDDLRAAAQQITENTADGVYGLVLPPDFARFIAFLYQAGGEVADPEFTEMRINSPEALEALNFYVDLVLDGYAAQAADLDSGWPGEAFGRGRAAMSIEGNWIIPFLADQFPDVNYGVTELPAGPGGQATMAFTVCYGVPANIPIAQQEAAFELVNYLTGPEGMEAWTDLGLAMPTRQSLQAQWLAQFPDLEPFLAGAEYARPWQFRPGFTDVLDTINAGLQQAMAGSVLPEDVLMEAEDVGNQVLAR
ncbi:MAG: ABC transporter substrate-binding protein [Caldilineaceae bacterium]|nr:ABC transporter substrate-binding protein [Caldilineaceae bacterium]